MATPAPIGAQEQGRRQLLFWRRPGGRAPDVFSRVHDALRGVGGCAKIPHFGSFWDLFSVDDAGR